MSESTLPLPGLSPVGDKAVVARFDGGRLSSDAGVLALREVEHRLGVAERLAGCLVDPRQRVEHRLAEIIRLRMLMIAAGYEDGNDADSLRRDPVFKMALEREPSAADLCSQSTVSRLENLPDRRTLLRMGHAMVDLYCGSFRQVPKRIVLDIDDTFDAVHGGQQLRLFSAYYDDYGFQPILVFDGEGRIVAAVLRPAKRPTLRQAQGARDPGALTPAGPAHPGQLAAGRDPGARRQPLLLPGSARLVPPQWGRLPARPRPEPGPAGPCGGAGGEHQGALRDS